MSKEVCPSSYLCDCGQVSHHFESTIRSLKQMSRVKRQTLVGDGEHEIIFHHGRFVAMWCPKEAREFPAELEG